MRNPRGTLPVPPTPFLGREAILDELLQRMRGPDCRLLTLTGPPGVGKTRLALELATALTPEYPDQVFFISLAAVDDPGLVPAIIAKAVGVREEEGSGPLEPALHAQLRDADVLLVLDNFEHVQRAARFVADLLGATHHVRVLVTSVAALRLTGEREYPIPPLELPPRIPHPSIERLGENAAVALFVARARSVRPSFRLDTDDADSVVELCHRLEGIPLAIELAAARSKLFSPQALLSRLDHRFAVLRGGPRDLPDRQQSLQAALDWSYHLLEPEEKQLLRRTAVFARSFMLESAEAVCGRDDGSEMEIGDGLEALLDHSLLHSEVTADGSLRFSMLETIRDYARGRLDAEEEPAAIRALRRRHALYFVRLAESAESRLRGAGQAEWFARLEAEHANLRAALSWCVESGDVELGQRLAGALWEFWLVHGHLSEALNRLEAVLDLGGEAGPPRAKVLCGAGIMARFQGDFGASRSRLAESEAMWRAIRDDWGLANALTYLGTTERYVGDRDAGRRHLDESLVLWRELGDRWGLALALSARAGLANAEGDYAAAHAFRQESLELYRAAGDHEGEARALIGLGEVARCRGDYEAARAWYEQGLELFRELGSRLHVAVTLQNLGHAVRHLGDPEEAIRYFMESLSLFRGLGHQVGAAACLVGLAGMELAQGRPESAARLIGAADRITDELGTILAAADRLELEHTRAAAESTIGAEAFAHAYREGGELGLDAAVALARGGEGARPSAETDGPEPEEPAAGAGSVARDPAHLTRRELDVIALLADGLTYVEIGDRLSISHRTVDAHLRSIYAKLDVSSRHAAVRQARRRQLL